MDQQWISRQVHAYVRVRELWHMVCIADVSSMVHQAYVLQYEQLAVLQGQSQVQHVCPAMTRLVFSTRKSCFGLPTIWSFQ